MDTNHGITNKQCKVEGCETQHRTRGLCDKHYRRWRVHGDPNVSMYRMTGTPWERLQGRYSDEYNGHGTPCWAWNGSKANGYGVIRYESTNIKTHIISYEHHYGPVPQGLEVDHCCCVKDCLNPRHLQAVTHKENCRRGNRPHMELWAPPYEHNYTGEYASLPSDYEW